MRATTTLQNIRLLSWFNFFYDFRLFGPFLIIYFEQVSGSYTLGGSLFAIIMISSAIWEIPAGIVSDSIPRVRVATYGAAATVLSVIAFAIATNFWVLAIGAVLEGLGRALFSGNNDALLRDSLAEHGRENEFHRFFSRTQAAYQIALTISAVIGGLLAGWSMRWAVAISIIPQVLSLLVTLCMREPRLHHAIEPVHPLRHLQNAARLVMKDKKLRLLSFASAIGFGAGESGWQLQPSFVATLWPSWAVGVGRAMNHATSIFGFLFAGKAIDRFGATKVLFSGSAIAGAIGLIAYGKPTIASPALTTLEGATYGSTSTAKADLFQRWFTDAERATMGSLSQFVGSMFFGIFAVVGGYLADEFNPQIALLVCHCASLVSLPIYWWIHRMVSRVERSDVTPS